MNETVSLLAEDLTQKDRYRTMIRLIVPRPIAWVSTVGTSGIKNLAPFSFFNAVSSDPPIVMISFASKSDGTQKDTLRNILDTKELVINIVKESDLKKMIETSKDYPYGVDEFEECGINSIPSLTVAPPRLESSPISLECTLDSIKEYIGDAHLKTTVVFAKIKMFHILKSEYKDGKPDPFSFKPLARLGGQDYAALERLEPNDEVV